jgi:hypothetical protein
MRRLHRHSAQIRLPPFRSSPAKLDLSYLSRQIKKQNPKSCSKSSASPARHPSADPPKLDPSCTPYSALAGLSSAFPTTILHLASGLFPERPFVLSRPPDDPPASSTSLVLSCPSIVSSATIHPSRARPPGRILSRAQAPWHPKVIFSLWLMPRQFVVVCQFNYHLVCRWFSRKNI